jgi:hypothetical protein
MRRETNVEGRDWNALIEQESDDTMVRVVRTLI